MFSATVVYAFFSERRRFCKGSRLESRHDRLVYGLIILIFGCLGMYIGGWRRVRVQVW